MTADFPIAVAEVANTHSNSSNAQFEIEATVSADSETSFITGDAQAHLDTVDMNFDGNAELDSEESLASAPDIQNTGRGVRLTICEGNDFEVGGGEVRHVGILLSEEGRLFDTSGESS